MEEVATAPIIHDTTQQVYVQPDPYGTSHVGQIVSEQPLFAQSTVTSEQTSEKSLRRAKLLFLVGFILPPLWLVLFIVYIFMKDVRLRMWGVWSFTAFNAYWFVISFTGFMIVIF
ncbi:hypothetical protein EIN_134410 [Entamoeba invadens IP1]|uniref:Uncharacterized protein n=1 Tax=Entamoeba invadens IP1 TaxID=370355 RepID=A0A0A1TX98_ENTIV|nr:hypothetical protein EIN_134410 [Entamoeba invadens IP1]ELP85897.1 hypothetical protein EIN_134410 [Entamoeba invadens IP1]|eukprot:XP_004185243.1 hypothetical protein EIN_134410 [Entamoeba invadens IP1]